MTDVAGGSLVDEFLNLVRNGELKQLRNLFERTALSVDAANEVSELDFLSSKQTDINNNMFLQNGSTALMMASLGGYLDIVHFLLDEKGAALGNINCVSILVIICKPLSGIVILVSQLKRLVWKHRAALCMSKWACEGHQSTARQRS